MAKVLRKLLNGPYREVDEQILRWRKHRKKKGALKNSFARKAKKPVRKNFFMFDSEDET